MSREDVHVFLEDVNREPLLGQRIAVAGDPGSAVRVAQELGYSFSEEDLRVACWSEGPSLTDQELEVAGSACFSCKPGECGSSGGCSGCTSGVAQYGVAALIGPSA